MSKHIRQITENDSVYIVVDTEGYVGDLENHPAIVSHPELFEVVEQDIPKTYEVLHFNNQTEE